MDEEVRRDQTDNPKRKTPRKAFILTENTIVYEAESNESEEKAEKQATTVNIQSHLPVDVKIDPTELLLKIVAVVVSALTFIVVVYYTKAAFIQAQAAIESANGSLRAIAIANQTLNETRIQFADDHRPYIWLTNGGKDSKQGWGMDGAQHLIMVITSLTTESLLRFISTFKVSLLLAKTTGKNSSGIL